MKISEKNNIIGNLVQFVKDGCDEEKAVEELLYYGFPAKDLVNWHGFKKETVEMFTSLEENILMFKNPVTVAISSVTNPDVGFAVTVEKKDLFKAKYAMKAGLSQWLSPSKLLEDSLFFDEEDLDWINGCGWAEPTIQILDMLNVDYMEEACWDDDGNWLESFDKSKVIEELTA